MDSVLITLAMIAGTVVAIVVWRRLFPGPMPAWFDAINTWYRNAALPPAVALEQFPVASGRRVLEIGPAGGYLTAAAAEVVRPTGLLVALDIQLSLLRKVRSRFASLVPFLVQGDASSLPFRDGTFDVVVLAGVLGEIPDREAALREIYRILVPGGTLAVSEEFLLDPDYMRLPVVLRIAQAAGFQARERFSSWFQYTQRFARPAAQQGATAAAAQLGRG